MWTGDEEVEEDPIPSPAPLPPMEKKQEAQLQSVPMPTAEDTHVTVEQSKVEPLPLPFQHEHKDELLADFPSLDSERHSKQCAAPYPTPMPTPPQPSVPPPTPQDVPLPEPTNTVTPKAVTVKKAKPMPALPEFSLPGALPDPLPKEARHSPTLPKAKTLPAFQPPARFDAPLRVNLPPLGFGKKGSFPGFVAPSTGFGATRIDFASAELPPSPPLNEPKEETPESVKSVKPVKPDTPTLTTEDLDAVRDAAGWTAEEKRQIANIPTWSAEEVREQLDALAAKHKEEQEQVEESDVSDYSEDEDEGIEEVDSDKIFQDSIDRALHRIPLRDELRALLCASLSPLLEQKLLSIVEAKQVALDRLDMLEDRIPNLVERAQFRDKVEAKINKTTLRQIETVMNMDLGTQIAYVPLDEFRKHEDEQRDKQRRRCCSVRRSVVGGLLTVGGVLTFYVTVGLWSWYGTFLVQG